MHPSALNLSALPSVAIDRRLDLPHQPGIYFVLDADGATLYIGRASDLRNRWANHHRRAEIRAVPGARIAWVTVSDTSLLAGIEAACIEHFAPRLNRTTACTGGPVGDPHLIRNNLYFSPEVSDALDRMVAECIAQFGRMPGRGGGWRSRIVCEAIRQFDIKAFIAEMNAA